MTPSQLQTSHTQLVAKVRQQAQELTESTLQLHNANVRYTFAFILLSTDLYLYIVINADLHPYSGTTAAGNRA